MASIPPYLRDRASSATQRARDAAKAATSAAPAPAAPQPSTAPPARASSNPDQPAQPLAAKAKPARKARGKGEGGGNPQEVSILKRGAAASRVADGVDYEALADHLVGSAADPVAAGILRPVLPGMLEARVQAAHLAGAAGVPDWAALTRMMKLPFATAATQAKAGRQLHVHLGERLAKALSSRDGSRGTHVINGVAEALSHADATVAALDGD